MDSRLLGAALPLPSLSSLWSPVPCPLYSLRWLSSCSGSLSTRSPCSTARHFPPTLSFRFLFGHLFLLRGFQEERSLPTHLHPSLEEGAVEFGKRRRAVSSGAFVVGADLSSAGVEERNGQGGGGQRGTLTHGSAPSSPEEPMRFQTILFPVLHEGCLPFQSTVVPQGALALV